MVFCFLCGRVIPKGSRYCKMCMRKAKKSPSFAKKIRKKLKTTYVSQKKAFLKGLRENFDPRRA